MQRPGQLTPYYIQCGIETYRDKLGNKLFEATLSLVEAITNRVKSCSKSHLMILKETFEFHLFVVSELYVHGKEESLIHYLEKTDDLLCQWINHPNVIGSNRIGGNNVSKLKEEFGV